MIPQVKVPTFSITLPVSKEKVEFRPFLVKEEKILLLAKDSKEPKDIARVIKDVVESCTFGKVDTSKICLASASSVELPNKFIALAAIPNKTTIAPIPVVANAILNAFNAPVVVPTTKA